jgi:hypothetical protein
MWTYVQLTGQMLNSDGTLLAKGYSGLGLAKNDPAAQHVPNMGPIPQGFYTIEAPIDSPTHGPFAMHLTPDSTNEMYDRSAFMIHGDSLHAPGTASEGCIILPPAARHTIWNSGDNRLQVIGQVIEQAGDEEMGTM